MPAVRQNFCTVDELEAACSSLSAPELGVTTAMAEDAVANATDLMWALTGRQYGSFTETLRPDLGGELSSYLDLERYPVASISSVKIDGVTVPASAYWVQDQRFLVKVDGTNWPSTQKLYLNDTEEGTFSVALEWGHGAPPAVKQATRRLACELLASLAGQDSALSDRITSVVRQGISMQMVSAEDLLDKGRTGIYEVDLVLSVYNEGAASSLPAVFSPDIKWLGHDSAVGVSGWASGSTIVISGGGGTGVTSHSALTQLDSDDHKQYQRAESVTVGANHTVTSESMVLVADPGAAITLPDGDSNDGRNVIILAGAGPTVVNTAGTDVINEGLTSLTVPAQNNMTFTSTDVAGTRVWITTALTGNAVSIPAWVGESITAGHVVAMGASGVPEWSSAPSADPLQPWLYAHSQAIGFYDEQLTSISDTNLTGWGFDTTPDGGAAGFLIGDGGITRRYTAMGDAVGQPMGRVAVSTVDGLDTWAAPREVVTIDGLPGSLDYISGGTIIDVGGGIGMMLLHAEQYEAMWSYWTLHAAKVVDDGSTVTITYLGEIISPEMDLATTQAMGFPNNGIGPSPTAVWNGSAYVYFGDNDPSGTLRATVARCSVADIADALDADEAPVFVKWNGEALTDVWTELGLGGACAHSESISRSGVWLDADLLIVPDNRILAVGADYGTNESRSMRSSVASDPLSWSMRFAWNAYSGPVSGDRIYTTLWSGDPADPQTVTGRYVYADVLQSDNNPSRWEGEYELQRFRLQPAVAPLKAPIQTAATYYAQTNTDFTGTVEGLVVADFGATITLPEVTADSAAWQVWNVGSGDVTVTSAAPINSVGDVTIAQNQVWTFWPLTGVDFWIGYQTAGDGGGGTPGADGKSVRSGASNPTSGVGNDGDFWINTATSVIFGPKSSGTWPASGTSLIGPQGTPGASGTPGTAATVSVSGTSTGAAGTSASVTNSGTSSAAILNFTIPRGDKGEKGDPGDPDVSTATREPIGHTDKSQSTISFNNSSRTFTIAPVSGTYEVWCAGTKYNLTSQSVTLPTTTGLYYISFTAGVLGYSTTYFVWDTETPTAYVYWNNDTGKAEFFADERHGVTLDWATHEYLHRTRGAAMASGFSLSGYTLVGTGGAAADAQASLSSGTFFDEDLQIDIVADATPTANTWEQDLLFPMKVPVFYLDGTAWRSDAPTNFPLKTGTARARYNLLTGSTWSTTDAGNSDYVVSWLVATNNLNYPVMAILGQESYGSLPAARNALWESLTLTNFPVFEFRPLYKLIFQTATSYANTPHARLSDVQDIRGSISIGSGTTTSDHGLLNGLADDDHVQYALADGSRGSFAALTHAGTHASTGSDPVTLAQSQVANLTTDLGNKAATSRIISAGTGLTGGGDLTADRTFSVSYGTTSGTAAQGNDSRLSDSRVPTSHAASHASTGSDALYLAASQIVTGTVATDRLGSGTASASTYLRGDQTWAAVTATPSAHAESHASTGTDALYLAASQIVTGTMATARLGTGTASSSTFLRGDGSFDKVGLSSALFGSTGRGIPSTLAVYIGQTTQALTANRLYVHPIYVPEPITITQAQLEVSTLAASSSAVIGIYNASVSSNRVTPTTLLAQFGSALSTATTGAKTVSSLSVSVPVGFYCLAWLSDSTATLRNVSGYPLGGMALVNPSGSANLFTALRAPYLSQTYSATLPSTAPAGSLSHDTAGASSTPHVNCPVWVDWTAP
jgi:hypothetical protein